MHDKHEPTCLHCADFIFPFKAGSPLSDWGYCRGDVADREPTPGDLEKIEVQAKNGDYSFLINKKVPLYQAHEEGCEKFKDLNPH